MDLHMQSLKFWPLVDPDKLHLQKKKCVIIFFTLQPTRLVQLCVMH